MVVGHAQHNAIVPRRMKGGARVQLLRMHRLLEFEKVFSLYLEGKAGATEVAARARKMLDIGLPRLR